MSKKHTRSHRRSLARARAELRALLRSPPRPVGLGPQGPAWHRLYTRRICRYLLEHLDDAEMRAWEVAFTGLHELVAQAWAARPRDPHALREREAWRDVSAFQHFVDAYVLTQLPPGIDVALLVPHMRGFLRFLEAEGAIDATDAERLDHEYATFDPTEPPRAVA